MIRQSRQNTQAAGGTITFPLFLFVCVFTPLFLGAHGTEFITARMKVSEDQSLIELRLGIDYLGNPMIADEAAACAALQQALHVRHGEKTSCYTDLAPLVLESSGTWEDTLPDSLQPPDDGQPHQILIGTWRWKADAQAISFSVAKGNRNDVLLWRPSEKVSEEIQSTLLLGGDVSPPLIFEPPPTFWRFTGWVLPFSVLAVVIGLRFRRRFA